MLKQAFLSTAAVLSWMRLGCGCHLVRLRVFSSTPAAAP